MPLFHGQSPEIHSHVQERALPLLFGAMLGYFLLPLSANVLIVAGTFVFVSGAVYYAFMAAWLNVFLLLGFTVWLRLLLGSMALVLGVVNLSEFWRKGLHFTLSIPASAKPGLYARMRGVMQSRSLPAALAAVEALAVVVNAVELLCTAGLPAV